MLKSHALNYIAVLIVNSCYTETGIPRAQTVFKVIHDWRFLNYTWPSSEIYQNAVISQQYIPVNNILAGIKVYENKFYLSLPRFFPGTPVTLASFALSSPRADPLLEPYPSWEMNVGRSCKTLQNVYSMEIDTRGIMWVLDGFRSNNLADCPPKIVLLDLNRNGQVIQTFEVPNEVSLHRGGWMNDLVVDETNGGYAYISDNSDVDPGVIVYSRSDNKGWKIRDACMFAELDGVGYTVRGVRVNSLINVDGIALAPAARRPPDRLFYYTALTGYSVYALNTEILRNESLCKTTEWRKSVRYIGRKPGASDGMIIDNCGNLYFGLLDKYGIARWNIYQEPFDKYVQTIYNNYKTVDWPDGFGMDTNGNLYVTSNGMERLINGTLQTSSTNEIHYRILQCHTGTMSYLYS